MVEQNKAFVPLSDDTDLDDIPDLPQYKVFPTGAYLVIWGKGFEAKDIGEHPAYELEMTLVEILEVSKDAIGADEELPKPGDTCTIAFLVDNEFGAGKFKEALKPIKAATGAGKIGQLVTASKGVKAMVVVNRTYNKDKDRYYANLKAVALA